MCPYCECELEAYDHIEDDIANGMPHQWSYEYYGCPKCDYTDTLVKEEVDYEYFI